MNLKEQHEARNHNSVANADLEQDFGNAAFRANETARITAPCRLHFHHVRKRLADIDGLSVKAVIDGLVRIGILADDSPEFVKEITHSQSQGHPEKTIIQIETI